MEKRRAEISGESVEPEEQRPDGERRAIGAALRSVVSLCAQMPRTIEDLGLELGCGRSEIYRHTAKAIELELVERHALLRDTSALLAATVAGHRFVGSGLSVQRISPGAFHHWLVSSRVACELGAKYPQAELLSEAELRQREQADGEPFASAEVGELPNGRPRLHRPDLVLVPTGGRPTVIEVELTAKAPDRLKAIIRGWGRSRRIARVAYLCAPGKAHRAVRSAIDAAPYREDRFVVSELQIGSRAGSR